MMRLRIVIGLVLAFVFFAVLLSVTENRIVASTGTNEPDKNPVFQSTTLPDEVVDISKYGDVGDSFSFGKEEEMKTPDESLAEVAKQFPAFGGLFFDQDGTLQVYMVNQKEPMEEGLTDVFKNLISTEILGGESLSETGVEFIEGEYTFVQLKQWHDGMSKTVLEIPGVVFTDIDDKKNRLRIGVENLEKSRGIIEDNLSNLGIPPEAVEIEEAEPVTFELRDRNRPLRGGYQINFTGFVCTLGFVADRGGVRGFVTNSHCTNTQGGTEGTIYHQPTSSGTTNRVGLESADPGYFTGGACPSGRRCRYSDSAFVRVPHPSGPTTSSTRGRIARPPSGSINWNGTDTYTITSESNPVVGQSMTKVGRTTGRTSGSVSATCFNVNVSGTTITQLCQSRASYNSAGGDSGSPVFRITSGFNVALAGIHWGSSGTFSPIGGIQRSGELGSVTTCSGGGC